MPTSRRAAAVLSAALALAACGSTAPDESPPGDRPSIVVGAYPYQFAAEWVAEDRADVANLVEPGAEPHDLELTPRQVADIAAADLVVYSPGFQPALDDAVAQQAAARAFDVMSAVDVRSGDDGSDPHVWLDPGRLAAIGAALAVRLAEADPENADAYADRADALAGELASLDVEIRTGLADCERRVIVTSHDAFGYLADAYRLTQVPIAGLSPDVEPSPKRVAELIALSRQYEVTTIFYEDLISPKQAESLAREVGVRSDVLSPLESAPENGDYLTGMRGTLQTLRNALGCA